MISNLKSYKTSNVVNINMYDTRKPKLLEVFSDVESVVWSWHQQG